MTFDSVPLEVFEQIVGSICFVDLPYFLQVSKRTHVLPPLELSDPKR